MKRSEVEKIVQGRVTDLLVAELVMGGIIECHPEERSKTSENWFWLSPTGGVTVGEAYEVPFEKKVYCRSYRNFCPSTNLLDSFMALETSHKYRIEKLSNGYEVATWVNEYAGARFAEAKTIELAICKSLLLWAERE